MNFVKGVPPTGKLEYDGFSVCGVKSRVPSKGYAATGP